MNIILSGWPGTGTTTLALLLANLLDYKYLYAGGLLKYIAKRSVGVESGAKYVEFEETVGPYWDMLWEKYAVWKLKNTDKLLLEGKTTGFFSDGEGVFEVMMIASTEERVKRAKFDKREDAEATIKARDNQLKERWQRLLGIDIFSPIQIQANYDLIIDNSNMTIQAELTTILSHLEEDYRFPSEDLNKQKKEVDMMVAEFWDKGKEYYRNKLKEKGLLITPEDILTEWQTVMGKDIDKLPEPVQKLFRV